MLHKTPIDVSKFFCVRYSDDRTIKYYIDGFSTSKNPMLAAYVKYKALEEDSDNKQAVYFIKDCNKIVSFFSLKCGLLIKCHRKVLTGVNHRNFNDQIEYYIDDDIINVTNTLPALEISHFCINETYKKKKTNWKIKNCIAEYSVGKYIFYKFIVPLIIDISLRIGLQIVYLFCADDGSGKLIEFYESLNFQKMDDMACIRSEYNENLSCFTCKIETLRKDFERFNDVQKADEIIEFLINNKKITVNDVIKKFNINDYKYLFRLLVDKGLVSISSKNIIKINLI